MTDLHQLLGNLGIRAPLIALKQQFGHAARMVGRKVARTDRELCVNYLRNATLPMLQVGCGHNFLPGWLNTDYEPDPGAAFLDAIRPFPFEAESFARVFSEHIIEHIPYPAGATMLRQCFRVLKPGGVLRISTPDLAFLIDLYCRPNEPLHVDYVRYSTDRHIEGAPAYSTAFVVNNFVRQWGHQFIYDEATLADALRAAGFADIRRCRIGESNRPELAGLENARRMPDGFLELESLILEATKPEGRKAAAAQNHAATKTQDLVSVIVPAYNAESSIRATLVSVIAQTYRNIEIIVVDDGSRDSTGALVEEMAEQDRRIRLVSQPNGGLVGARNAGIAHARGEFIAPLDSDDLWHPTKLAKQVDVLSAAGPSTAAVYCWTRAIGSDGRVLFDLPKFAARGDVFASLLLWNFIHSGAPLVRRQCVAAIRGYDATLRARGVLMCEDLKFSLDLAERWDFDLVPEFLTGYRLDPASMSGDTRAMHRSRLDIVNEAHARHPELPAELLQLALGISARVCAGAHLRKGAFLPGVKLLAHALRLDPSGTMSAETVRFLIGGVFAKLGLREWLKAIGARTAFSRAPVGAPFAEVDSRAFCYPARSNSLAKHLAAANTIRTRRTDRMELTFMSIDTRAPGPTTIRSVPA